MLVWVYYPEKPNWVKETLEKGIKFRLNMSEEYCLNSENTVWRDKNNMITVTYRGEVTLNLGGNVRYSPFDIFEAKFHVEFSHFEV